MTRLIRSQHRTAAHGQITGAVQRAPQLPPLINALTPVALIDPSTVRRLHGAMFCLQVLQVLHA